MTTTHLASLIETTQTEALRLSELVKTYGSGAAIVTALRGVDLVIPAGSFTAIMGPSGSGKSTLLQSAAGLDRPTSGTVHLGGTELTTFKAHELTAFRRDHVGFVFQAYNLLPALNVEENVILPLRLGGRPLDHHRLETLLDAVDLADQRFRRPAELSGGQQQRVAIARALIMRPHVVFGDEPTGALDSRTGAQVLDLLVHTAKEWRQTVVVVTHDPVVASRADRVVFLADGVIAGELDGGTPQQITDCMSRPGAW